MLYRVWETAANKHLGLIAAGVAFFGMFAIFPGITAIIAIFGLLADPIIVAEQLALMEDIIPPDAYRLFQAQITGLLVAGKQTLGFATGVSILLAVWASRAGVAALIGGLNAIEGMPNRNGFKQVLVALMLTISLVVLAIVALGAVVIMPIILAFVPLANSTAWLLEGVRWLLALSVLFAGLSILYRFGPNMRPERRPWVTLGAAIVIVLWIAASVGLSFYLTNFASYNEVYGSLGAVIGLLLWLYISAYLIMLGAVLNAQIYGKSPEAIDLADDDAVLPDAHNQTKEA
ncbi:YihY/virulence factor BrkB family protein [Yoonia sp. 208BN28-4]|uniref:YihY/virulence factor BrkB family protein n=1 Tax=Yoonia sp. 208BN28-4 TaxID=3126505 RepID=UPI0030B1FC0B